MFSRKKNLPKPCPNCGKGPSWGVLKMIDATKRERYPYYCICCGVRTQLFVKKVAVDPSIIEGPPNVVIQPNIGKCERCKNETHVEEHHWVNKRQVHGESLEVRLLIYALRYFLVKTCKNSRKIRLLFQITSCLDRLHRKDYVRF